MQRPNEGLDRLLVWILLEVHTVGRQPEAVGQLAHTLASGLLHGERRARPLANHLALVLREDVDDAAHHAAFGPGGVRRAVRRPQDGARGRGAPLDGRCDDDVARHAVALRGDEDSGAVYAKAFDGRRPGRRSSGVAPLTPWSSNVAAIPTPWRAAHASIAARWASGPRFWSSVLTRT